MIHAVSATITTDADGNAEIYFGTSLYGKVEMIKYVPGTIATGADLTITGETTGIPILVKANAGTATAWYFPRSQNHSSADGSAIAYQFDRLWVVRERIKLVVAQGGAGGVGSMTIWVVAPMPF